MYVFLSTEHHSLECKVFIYYYSHIVNVLSASATELSTHFVQKGIILCESQQEIMDISKRSPTKATGILLSPISSALMSRLNEGFYAFLKIAEQYGKGSIKELISTIRKKLLELKLKEKGTL